MGQKKVSFTERCPHFNGCKGKGVLFREVSSVQECPYKPTTVMLCARISTITTAHHLHSVTARTIYIDELIHVHTKCIQSVHYLIKLHTSFTLSHLLLEGLVWCPSYTHSLSLPLSLPPSPPLFFPPPWWWNTAAEDTLSGEGDSLLVASSFPWW